MAVQVQFQDMIGQPTWIAPFTIQVKLVMRCDIHIGYQVSLPPTWTNVQSGASVFGVGAKLGFLGFSGTYTVVHVRHTGVYDSPDGNNWCTIVDLLDSAGALSAAGNVAAGAISALSGVASSIIGTIGSDVGSIVGGTSQSLIRGVRRY